MKTFASLAASILAVAVLGLTPPANAAPAGPASVDATIDYLREQGLQVVVNRTGTGAMAQCAINSVRPGQTFSRADSGSGKPGSWNDIVTTMTSNTVYVDITC